MDSVVSRGNVDSHNDCQPAQVPSEYLATRTDVGGYLSAETRSETGHKESQSAPLASSLDDKCEDVAQGVQVQAARLQAVQ